MPNEPGKGPREQISSWSGHPKRHNRILVMERRQKHSGAFSTLFFAPTVRVPPSLGGIRSHSDTFLAHFGKGARRIGQVFPRLPPLPFREKSNPNWGSEVRGWGGPKDFVVVILAHYLGWVTTVNEGDHDLQLNTVLKDVQILLESIGYQQGDTSRRWYFVTDFDPYFNGEQVPRAKIPGTDRVALPTEEGISAILREASREGGSGFVHCGVHCMYRGAGTSVLTPEANEKIRYTEVPNGLPTKEAFIVGTDGMRVYGQAFIECLSDGDERRCGTTLTLSFDMCNSTEFLAGVVELPYQYRSPTFDGGATEPVATRSTNQLVVISASQRGQVAGTYRECGALTYLLAAALRQQVSTAPDIVRYIHGVCETQPKPEYLQTPQIASRYPLTGSFWLIPERHSAL